MDLRRELAPIEATFRKHGFQVSEVEMVAMLEEHLGKGMLPDAAPLAATDGELLDQGGLPVGTLKSETLMARAMAREYLRLLADATSVADAARRLVLQPDSLPPSLDDEGIDASRTRVRRRDLPQPPMAPVCVRDHPEAVQMLEEAAGAHRGRSERERLHGPHRPRPHPGNAVVGQCPACPDGSPLPVAGYTLSESYILGSWPST
ncbi:MAG: hypothetical protein ACYDD0_09585 [Candidatus Dormibacteria bacterium]